MRQQIADKYIKGRGLEIGAFHNPWPTNAEVIYTDRCELDILLKTSGWKGDSHKCVKPDFIDDGSKLKNVPSETFDFVIGSHILEHCKSPLTALENHCRVLKKGGYLVHAVPEKTKCFDKDRPNATVACLIQDHCMVDHKRLRDHYREYYIYVDRMKDGPELEKRINESIINDVDIHFHAWDFDEMKKMFEFAAGKIGMSIEFVRFVDHEVFFVLKKN